VSLGDKGVGREEETEEEGVGKWEDVGTREEGVGT
jgi:hypothetical protein